jgi:diguanylate cyclase (GGDEF)-like protein
VSATERQTGNQVVAALTRDRAVERALAAAGPSLVVRGSLEELLGAVEGTDVRAFVIDPPDGGEGALHRLAGSPRYAAIPRIRIDRTGAGDPQPGSADALAAPDVVADLLAAATPPPSDLAELIEVSLLSGLDAAAEAVSRAFGVARCLISARGDSSGGGAGQQTWTSLEWSEVASRCRAAAAAAATLVARVSDARCHSYAAVRLGQAPDVDGFLGLVSNGPRVFSAAERGALAALARRFAAELDSRAGHERLADEVDQLVQGPGLDPVIGMWNRAALEQLAPMQMASARRDQVPLAVAVFDVVDLHAINNRHGLAAGDALLRRLADGLRAQVREEDLVGRWSGDEIAVMLRGTTAEVARGVAGRLLASLFEHPLELADGQRMTAAATVGIASMADAEGMEPLFQRAAHAARDCQRTGRTIAGASEASGAPKISRQLESVRNLAPTLGGTYRLIHEISRGGMGVVYRAQDLALERPVAVKMLRPDIAGQPGVAERFRTEAAMLARLRHPNLVQVYSFGASGGDWYFVMELVEGESREQAIERCRLERVSLPLAEIAAVVAQIASALDTLHERGIVHRDVKPANLILDPFRDRAVLVDVGIARRYEERAASAGTPGYVAPEVIAGGEATPLSDVYGLAATTYAMLTLAEPWSTDDGDLRRLLHRQWRGDFTLPSALRAELAPVDDLIRVALNRDLRHRPASAGAFAAELGRCLASVAEPRTRPARSRGEKPTGVRRSLVEVAAGARTRGVAFRSIASVVGVREAERMRNAIGADRPDLAQALSPQTAPLAWLPTGLLVALLRVAAVHSEREVEGLARDAARAAVRASFRRFFPVSPATLVPDSALSAIASIWTRYHTWGAISSMPVAPAEVVVRRAGGPREAELCAWTRGMLEQVVLLAGGALPTVQHHACEARGAPQCLFRVRWTTES